MGIDIYMSWEGQTNEEEGAQITGYAIDAGDKGYLREAYHGGPYATRVLVPEAFNGEAQIHAKRLRERLPLTILTAIERAAKVYKKVITEDSPEIRSFKDFVALAEKIEARTGKPVTVDASY